MTFSTIGDHVELQRGTTYKSALLDQPGPVLLGLGSIERDGGFKSDKLRTYGGPSAEKLLVRPGDLYVSLKDVTQSGDLLGAIARVPESVSVGRMTQDTVKLIFKSSIPKEYFYWMLRTPQYRQYCRSHATGTTNLGLSREDFFAFKIPCLDEKKRLLVNALESIEGKVKLNGRINQTLEQLAQAIFKSWFVDFEPVKAKIAALEAGGSEEDALLAAMQAVSGKDDAELTRLQAEQPEQYAELRATAELFPSAMQDSELGEIPEGWTIVPFSSIARLDTTSVKPAQDPEKVWEHYSIPAFDEGATPAFETGADIKSNKYKVYPTAVLSSKLNPHFPRTWIPDVQNPGAAICSTEFMQFVPLEPQHRAFIAGMITSEPFQSGIMMRVTGSTGSRQRAQPKQVAAMDVILPKSELRSVYSQHTEAMYRMQSKNIWQARSLASLRDTLLPKLLSGELSTPNAMVEATA